MGRVVAIANQKGGVGKTTTAINLAASLAVAEQRILLVDGDPQGNATSGMGLVRDQITATTYDALLGQIPASRAIIHGVQFPQLDVLPATPELAGAEVELVDFDGRERAMRKALAPIRDQYDWVLIDCPPSLGLITLNMLAAAATLLIPLPVRKYYALEGISQLLNTVHLVQRSVNESLAIDGVLLTMYDARLNLSRQVATEAREYFGGKVFDTVIPRNVRLAEAPSFGKPIISYDVASGGRRPRHISTSPKSCSPVARAKTPPPAPPPAEPISPLPTPTDVNRKTIGSRSRRVDSLSGIPPRRREHRLKRAPADQGRADQAQPVSAQT